MIGDGSRINVWGDEWIPNSPTRKVITARGDSLLSKVSDFIDPVMGRWDEELVSQTFWKVDGRGSLRFRCLNLICLIL